VAVQWLNRALCFYQSLCLVDSEVLLNRHLRVAAKRYAQAEKRQRHSKLTMKMNIKLGMKNLTDRQITRHSLPTRMCFNFFFPPHKNLKFSRPTLHTLPKPHVPTLQPKLYQRVQFCKPAIQSTIKQL